MIAFVIATGASLTQADIDLTRGYNVYVVKEAHRLAPWAKHLYCGDYDWFDYYKGLPEFAGEKWCCCENTAKKYRINYIAARNDIAWSDNPDFIATGGNSGFQALNLAALHGHDFIVLMGFDMKYGDKRNFYTGEDARPKRPSDFTHFIKCFNKAKPMIKARVINTSLDSALECFPKMSVTDALHLYSTRRADCA